ncbi:hypothetical protein V5O48_016726 [Marasmius crinis-equi]|uniref:Biogenesis of lysosome-related organelles complex 1 subunit 1 n=1 Tax=Marasmius crinis-equi TaxID=585013 RepID=A0ABR3ER20_9AGAR
MISVSFAETTPPPQFWDNRSGSDNNSLPHISSCGASDVDGRGVTDEDMETDEGSSGSSHGEKDHGDDINDAVMANFERGQEEVKVVAMLGLSTLRHQLPAGFGRPLDINNERYIRQCDANHRLEELQFDYYKRTMDLKNEISRLRDQISAWNRLAVTVAEGVYRDMNKWSGLMNDAILEGIENVEVPALDDEDVMLA